MEPPAITQKKYDRITTDLNAINKNVASALKLSQELPWDSLDNLDIVDSLTKRMQDLAWAVEELEAELYEQVGRGSGQH